MMQVQRAISRTAQARPWLRLAVNTCALLAALGAVGVTQADEQRIRAALEPRFNLKFDEVRPLPVGGLWEVVSGMRVFYTDAEASFLLAGTLIDVANERNLTAETAQRLLRVDIGALPVADAVRVVRGDGTRRLYVFEDPNCPHCKALETELAKLDNLTLYAFSMPILGPDSLRKSRAIWCASDRAAARARAFAGATLDAVVECDTPIERNLALADRLHIEATPTIVFSDGSRHDGELSQAQLEAELARRVPAPAAPAKP